MPRTSVLPTSLLTAGALLIAGVSFAAWSNDPAVNLPVVTAPGSQAAYEVVSDGAGSAWIVFMDSTVATGYDIRVTHVFANGTVNPMLPANGRVVCDHPAEQYVPSAVPDGSGGVYIAWADFRAGNYDIYAHHVLSSGVMDPAWPVNGLVVSNEAGHQFMGPGTGSFSELIADGSGGAIVTWTDNRNSNSDIYVHKLVATGLASGWPVNGRGVCTEGSFQQAPALTSDGAGGAIIAWADYRAGSFDANIYAHHVTSNGNLDGNYPFDGLAVCTAPANQGYPEGVADGAGGAYLAWGDRRGGGADIYAHHLAGNGTLSGSVPANGVGVCTAAGDQNRVMVARDGAGGLYVMWFDHRDGVNEAVYAHHIKMLCEVDPAWPVDGLAIRVEAGDKFVGSASARGFTSDGVGGAIMTWKDFRNGNWDIYAHRVIASGKDPAWPAEGSAICTATGLQSGPHVLDFGSGDYMVAWTDNRNGPADIYAQRVTRSGDLHRIIFVGAGPLPGLRRGTVDWGDYDGDGDLDLLATGTDGAASRTILFANNAGTLVNANAGIVDVEWSAAEWGDYDGDGDLDIAIAGLNNTTAVARIYRNDNGVFTDIAAGLPGVWRPTVAWGDFDSDGDLDLVLAGRLQNSQLMARVYRNDDEAFIDINAGLMGVENCHAEWGDIDRDGRLDFVLGGWTGFNMMTLVYINDGDDFIGMGTLPGTEGMDGLFALGDYDADGDLDVVISGWDESNRRLAILRNDLGSFSDIDANLPGISSGSVTWGDYDNDGDLDILASGYGDVGTNGRSDIYVNDEGVFRNAEAGLPSRYYSAVAWVDFDNDGDLDVTITGTTNDLNALTELRISQGATPNTPPAAPTNLSAVRVGGGVHFSWTLPGDAQTPTAGLSFNLRVGTVTGANDVMPSHSGIDGYRRVVRVGNVASLSTLFHLYGHTLFLEPGVYAWNVQAVDGAFAGSPWSANAPVSVSEGGVIIQPGVIGASPNPFRASTEISFAQAQAGRLDVAVYDLAGRRVRVLSQGERAAGVHRVTWDGRGVSGARLPAGMYLVRFSSDSGTHSRKVVLAD